MHKLNPLYSRALIIAALAAALSHFLDPVSGRIDKGCFFSSVFSTGLAELKPGSSVIHRIDAQRRFMELANSSTGQKVSSAKNLGLAMKESRG